jgi:hypothetical protein
MDDPVCFIAYKNPVHYQMALLTGETRLIPIIPATFTSDSNMNTGARKIESNLAPIPIFSVSHVKDRPYGYTMPTYADYFSSVRHLSRSLLNRETLLTTELGINTMRAMLGILKIERVEWRSLGHRHRPDKRKPINLSLIGPAS